jgi:protein disulfide-isomerase A6
MVSFRDIQTQLTQKKMDVPVWIWLILGVIGAYLLYTYFKKSSSTSNVSKTDGLMKEAKIKVYNFNTPWCGHSRNLLPEWNEFEKAVKNNSNIEAENVNCDERKDMCDKFPIPGYPTILVVKDGDQIPYEGERTSKAILDFVSRM